MLAFQPTRMLFSRLSVANGRRTRCPGCSWPASPPRFARRPPSAEATSAAVWPGSQSETPQRNSPLTPKSKKAVPFLTSWSLPFRTFTPTTSPSFMAGAPFTCWPRCTTAPPMLLHMAPMVPSKLLSPIRLLLYPLGVLPVTPKTMPLLADPTFTRKSPDWVHVSSSSVTIVALTFATHVADVFGASTLMDLRSQWKWNPLTASKGFSGRSEASPQAAMSKRNRSIAETSGLPVAPERLLASSHLTKHAMGMKPDLLCHWTFAVLSLASMAVMKPGSPRSMTRSWEHVRRESAHVF
mmetsp:Transcript_8085/g.22509  ORF Transcript_8085/g.22509 Transcript_8085/m.22509 type:complete len:296 (+) Transcript_8085:1788-2675(+)